MCRGGPAQEDQGDTTCFGSGTGEADSMLSPNRLHLRPKERMCEGQRGQLDPRPEFKRLLRGAIACRLDLSKEKRPRSISEFIPKALHMVTYDGLGPGRHH